MSRTIQQWSGSGLGMSGEDCRKSRKEKPPQPRLLLMQSPPPRRLGHCCHPPIWRPNRRRLRYGSGSGLGMSGEDCRKSRKEEPPQNDMVRLGELVLDRDIERL